MTGISDYGAQRVCSNGLRSSSTRSPFVTLLSRLKMIGYNQDRKDSNLLNIPFHSKPQTTGHPHLNKLTVSLRWFRLLNRLICVAGCDEGFNVVAGCDATCGPHIRGPMPLASRHQGTTVLVHMRIQFGKRTISAV